jgi:ABC-type nitrate/sulfonate/bicarbonate transport system permease component
MKRGSRQEGTVRFEYVIPILSPVLILVVWEIAVRVGMLHPLFFPPPSAIFQTLFKLIDNGELQSNLYPTLRRIFLGFALGAVPGLILGLGMGWSPKLRLVLDPIISALYPIPKIAILPLVMLVLGIGEISKMAIVGIGSFFLISINSMAGVRNIDRIFFEVAENYNASKLKIFTRVVFPGSLPMIFAGMRLALGMSLLLVVAVEFNTANEGIGVMIWLAWETLRTERLYVGVMICALLGLVFSEVLRRIERHFMPWEETFIRKE